jgi:hypothetical protein
MRKLFSFVIAFGMLSSACATTSKVIPDPSIPHEVSKEAEIEVWCGTPDRHLKKCKVRLLDGWWVASPAVVQ